MICDVKKRNVNSFYHLVQFMISKFRFFPNKKNELVISKVMINFYFILGSEIMENISAIKVVSIYSEMIWYHFTVD